MEVLLEELKAVIESLFLMKGQKVQVEKLDQLLLFLKGQKAKRELVLEKAEPLELAQSLWARRSVTSWMALQGQQLVLFVQLVSEKAKQQRNREQEMELVSQNLLVLILNHILRKVVGMQKQQKLLPKQNE